MERHQAQMLAVLIARASPSFKRGLLLIYFHSRKKCFPLLASCKQFVFILRFYMNHIYESHESIFLPILTSHIY